MNLPIFSSALKSAYPAKKASETSDILKRNHWHKFVAFRVKILYKTIKREAVITKYPSSPSLELNDSLFLSKLYQDENHKFDLSESLEIGNGIMAIFKLPKRRLQS